MRNAGEGNLTSRSFFRQLDRVAPTRAVQALAAAHEIAPAEPTLANLVRPELAVAVAEELERTERAGKAFAQALEFSELQPDTIGHRAGGEWADKGLELLTEALADAGTSGAELARVAGDRLKWKD